MTIIHVPNIVIIIHRMLQSLAMELPMAEKPDKTPSMNAISIEL